MLIILSFIQCFFRYNNKQYFFLSIVQTYYKHRVSYNCLFNHIITPTHIKLFKQLVSQIQESHIYSISLLHLAYTNLYSFSKELNAKKSVDN